MNKEKFLRNDVINSNKYLIQEYVKPRINALEIDAEDTLNALDRLEIRARITELEILQHFLESFKPQQKLIKAIFCSGNDNDNNDDDNGSNGKA